MEIRVRRGDITTLAVDAIVNAANEGLQRGGGVCGAIFAAAGARLDDACDAIGHCATGDAVVTDGFDLPARFVVHAVGPVWHGGTHGEPDLLASCYRRSVEVAAAAGARSVAFPAISTGIYGYPPGEAADVAVSTLRSLVDASGAGPLDEVVLVAFDTDTETRYQSLLTDC
jgi:O-acetyl-ADP-ribose deacetylase (regulator of RNase III)